MVSLVVVVYFKFVRLFVLSRAELDFVFFGFVHPKPLSLTVRDLLYFAVNTIQCSDCCRVGQQNLCLSFMPTFYGASTGKAFPSCLPSFHRHHQPDNFPCRFLFLLPCSRFAVRPISSTRPVFALLYGRYLPSWPVSALLFGRYLPSWPDSALLFGRYLPRGRFLLYGRCHPCGRVRASEWPISSR
jgi:hypothetical protein